MNIVRTSGARFCHKKAMVAVTRIARRIAWKTSMHVVLCLYRGMSACAFLPCHTLITPASQGDDDAETIIEYAS